MNFQYANEKCRKIGKKKLAGKDDKFILALPLAKGDLEKPETARLCVLPGKENWPISYLWKKHSAWLDVLQKSFSLHLGNHFAACYHHSGDWNVPTSATDLHPEPRHNK